MQTVWVYHGLLLIMKSSTFEILTHKIDVVAKMEVTFHFAEVCANFS